MSRATAIAVFTIMMVTGAAADVCYHWTNADSASPANNWDSIAFDERRGVVVRVRSCGIPDSTCSETLEWDGYSWIVRDTPIAPRYDSGLSMAYDSARHVTVAFVRSPMGWEFPGETWEWDGQTWALRSTTGPLNRGSAAMAYDSVRNEVVMFSGFPISRNDTWTWNGEMWTLKSTTGPLPRSNARMVFDQARGVMVLFGGFVQVCCPPGPNDETWEWNGEQWIQRTSSDRPSPRYGHAMVYDVNGGVTIVAGGGRESGSSFFNLTDLWEWDGETWIRREEECPARWQTASAFDSVRGVIVLNGGLYVERQTWEGTRQLFGDIDGDHVVTLTDLSELLARFGLQGQPLPADLNGDWIVDLSDLSILLSTFGESCN